MTELWGFARGKYAKNTVFTSFKARVHGGYKKNVSERLPLSPYISFCLLMSPNVSLTPDRGLQNPEKAG